MKTSDTVTRILAYVLLGAGIFILCKAVQIEEPQVITEVCTTPGCGLGL